MAVKIYLAVIGLIYLALAVWCVAAPQTTSDKVGFTLNGDSGMSEFMTVYGGLEFGLALIFLMPLVWSEASFFSLISCVLLHGSLVAFRSASLLIYSETTGFTNRLAFSEWCIFLCGLVLLIGRFRSTAPTS